MKASGIIQSTDDLSRRTEPFYPVVGRSIGQVCRRRDEEAVGKR
jgi:hypothetical protein